MSKNAVNCGSSGGAVGAEVKFAGNDSKSKMYEPKHKKKLVRVLTVIAYIFSVSLAAITLSLFYLFIYNPGKQGHNVGTSNSSAGGKFYVRNNEGFLLINNTYANYDREEPRALPLETVQAQAKRSVDASDDKPKIVSNEAHSGAVAEKEFLRSQIVRTLIAAMFIFQW